MNCVQILLIEDNADHAQLISGMLAATASVEYSLTHCETLEDGIRRLSSPGIDVVLLDLGLPDSHGAETFYKLSAAVPDVPILVLSGERDEEMALETVRRGAQDYLVKGRADRFALSRAITYAIERHRDQVALREARDRLEERVAERTAEITDAYERLEAEVKDRRKAEADLRESNTQLGHALKKLKETQEGLIQRERLHALGRMSSGIAHDFNNSLAPVVGFAELLVTKPEILENREKTLGYLKRIHTAADESARVVARLRNFFRERSEEEVFKPLCLAPVVRDAVAMTRARWKDQALAAGTSIRIETDLDEAVTICGDEAELREVVASLIINSVDAITDSGEIEITLRTRESAVELTIRDSGAGMSGEVLSHCLEPFYSTKGEHGTGLGLGVAYGVISRHEGTIAIDSNEGEGTTVRIVFPARTETESLMEEASNRPVTAARILVVEDEPMVREVLEIYLTGDGHEVVLAEDGVDGLEKFEMGTFDLVLTDRAMPEMNGDQLAGAIKDRSPGTPVVLLTGYGDLMDGMGETVPGVDMILSKPFTVDSLREAISRNIAK